MSSIMSDLRQAAMHSGSGDIAGVIAPPPVIAAAVLVLGALLDWLMPAYLLALIFPMSTRLVLGFALVFGGAALAVAGERAFSRAGTEVKPWKPSRKLVTGGPYDWMRNPMYVGLAFVVGGLGIAMASDWTISLLLPAAFVMHYGVVLREERYLEAKFGEAYRAYMLRVPRYGWPPRE
jgi:protein-S-isoprenylcysteine O-methyltransferase Ste14